MDKTILSRTTSLDLNDPKEKKKLSKGFSQPKRTIEYKVCTSDSLQSVALHFNTTPSELSRLNHLYGQTLFPGQKLYVPDPSEDQIPCLSPTSHSSFDQSTPLLDLPIVSEALQDIPLVHQQSSKSTSPVKQNSDRAHKPPGRAHRQGSGDLPEGGSRERPALVRQGSSRDVVNPVDTEYCEKFLKINCKHITKGQGVVSGVLLVTPNCIMFDPNVSDPLVVENGADTYGMLAPMETIISSSMYQDTTKLMENMSPREYSCNIKDYVSREVYRPASVSSSEDGSQPSTEHFAKRSQTIDSILDSAKNQPESRMPQSSVSQDLAQPQSQAKHAILPGVKVSIQTEPTSSVTQSEQLTEVGSDSQAQKDISPEACHNESSKPGHLGNLSLEVVSSQGNDGSVITPSVTIPTLSDNGGGGRGNQTPEADNPATVSDMTTTSCSGTGTTVTTTTDVLATNSTTPAFTPATATATVAATNTEGSMVPVASGLTICSGQLLSQTPPRTSFVDFSCGFFVKEQDPADRVMDISEAIRDSSANQQEIERIKASARRVRLSTPRHHRTPRRLQHTESLDSWRINYKDLLPKKTYAVEEPLYLCLKIGKPKTSAYSSSGGVFESYCKKKKPEYWFAVPRDRADHLYAFFVQWSPNIYGKDDIDPEELGFVVIEEENGEPIELVDGYFEEPVAKDWEIVTVQEARRRVSMWEVMNNLPLPDLIGESTILQTDNIATLCKNLPPRVEGYSWTLIYSTMQHGFSLKTLYRSMGKHESPVLLVVKDSDSYIFGALASCPFKVSDHFYGTGETFLFKFTPKFSKYGWSGDNTFFIKGDMDSLAIGGGSGIFGLWLDGDLYHGRSKSCNTFNNDILSAKEDFVVEELEAWGFE